MDSHPEFRSDRDEIVALLNKIDNTSERSPSAHDDLEATFASLCRLLEAHTEASERDFYDPLLRRHTPHHDLLLKGMKEHEEIEFLLSELKTTPMSDDTWLPLLAELKGTVEAHLASEEADAFAVFMRKKSS